MRSAKSSKPLLPACGPELVRAAKVIRVVAIVRWQTGGFADGLFQHEPEPTEANLMAGAEVLQVMAFYGSRAKLKTVGRSKG